MSEPLVRLINFCPQCGVTCQKNAKFCIECGICFVKKCMTCRINNNVLGWWECCIFCGKKMLKPNEQTEFISKPTPQTANCPPNSSLDSMTVTASILTGHSKEFSSNTEESNGYTEESNGNTEESNGYTEESNGYTEESNGYTEESNSYTEESYSYTEESTSEEDEAKENVEVNVGILIDDIPVSKSNGGGYGCIKLEKLETSLALIFDRMKDLYFPIEGTSLGKRAYYDMFLLDFKQEKIENIHFKSLDNYMQSNGLDFTSKLFFLQISLKNRGEKHSKQMCEPSNKRKRKADTSSIDESDSGRSSRNSSSDYDSKRTKKIWFNLKKKN